jgi:ribonuclease HII
LLGFEIVRRAAAPGDKFPGAAVFRMPGSSPVCYGSTVVNRGGLLSGVPAGFAPALDHERAFWRAGLECVAGVDEVGRGALAGPLVAAAVVLPASAGWALRRLRSALTDVRDSKALTPEQRERIAEEVESVATAIAVGVVPSEELDEVGLSAANRLAMERAVWGLAVEPEVLLLDACVLDLGLPQVGPIRGDALCLSIAAASVVAKVARDRMMVEHDLLDRRYGFAIHKGYGTPFHRAAIRLHGPCSIHRRCFSLGWFEEPGPEVDDESSSA